MRTEQWIKKLGGHAGELYVAAELSKRGIPNALLPENFSDDDILIGDKAGTRTGYVQVKSCHPDRAKTFILKVENEAWADCKRDEYVVFVWLGSPSKNESPHYWVADKREVGIACCEHPAHGTSNWERRFSPKDLNPSWDSNWGILSDFTPMKSMAE
jgi:hypothetical protein